MNVISWVILAIIAVWIVLAVRSALFSGSRKGSCHEAGEASAMLLDAEGDDDEKYRLPSACAGCSKGSCSGCPSANRDIPVPIIHDL